jgi:hypothetical protein
VATCPIVTIARGRAALRLTFRRPVPISPRTSQTKKNSASHSARALDEMFPLVLRFATQPFAYDLASHDTIE